MEQESSQRATHRLADNWPLNSWPATRHVSGSKCKTSLILFCYTYRPSLVFWSSLLLISNPLREAFRLMIWICIPWRFSISLLSACVDDNTVVEVRWNQIRQLIMETLSLYARPLGVNRLKNILIMHKAPTEVWESSALHSIRCEARYDFSVPSELKNWGS